MVDVTVKAEMSTRRCAATSTLSKTSRPSSSRSSVTGSLRRFDPGVRRSAVKPVDRCRSAGSSVGV